MPKDDYIELRREFAEFSEDHDPMAWDYGLGKKLFWNELLERRLVVVLGEAGNGKTTEFRQRSRVLCEKGKSAFFLDITALAQDGVDVAVDDPIKFEHWIDSEDHGYFFLDSVDEALLRHASFGRALRKFRARLGDAIGRSSIYVSSRCSDWQYDSHRAEIQSLFSRKEESRTQNTDAPEEGKSLENTTLLGGEENPNVFIVSLRPLNGSQIKLLASHLGVTSVNDFIVGINKAGAQDFAGRPLDVKWLVDYWNQHGKIGSLTELVESSIAARLKETRRPPCPSSTLSSDRAMDGLMALSGIATLTGRWSFSIPGEYQKKSAHNDPIDPDSVLQDWAEGEIRELLTRAVFDESTYGEVRICHRAVQEYLSSKWLQCMLKSGLRRNDLDGLLFKRAGERRFVPRHLAPITAWLSLSDSETLEQLTKCDPAVLLQEGDPERLSIPVRERILDSYLSLYESCEWLYPMYDYVSLRRFARKLGHVVQFRLKRTDLPDDAVRHLFELVELGKLSICLSDAMTWATKTGAESRTRCSAIDAIFVMANPGEKRRLVSDLLSMDVWPQDMAGTLLSKYYPGFVSTDQLLEIMSKVQHEARNYHDGYTYFISNGLSTMCPSADRQRVLSFLFETDRATPNAHSSIRDGIVSLCAVELESLGDNDEPTGALRDALGVILDDRLTGRSSRHQFDIKKAIQHKVGVRKWQFWRRVAELEEMSVFDGIRKAWFIQHNYPLTVEDVPWLLQGARQHEEQSKRRLCFGLLLGLKAGCPSLEDELCQLAREDESFSEIEREERERREMNSVVPEPCPFEMDMRERENKQRQKAEKEHAENLKVLNENIDSIRSGENTRLLSWVRLDADSGEGPRRGFLITKVRESYGDLIADAVSCGMKAFWRTHIPKFKFEQDDRNLIYNSTLVGLAGLDLDFDDGLSIDSMSTEDAKTAARYAIHQINGFPDWFESLSTKFPQEVVEALNPSIVEDLRLVDEKHWPEFLVPLERMPASLRDGIARVALEEIEKQPPTHERSLQYGLTISTYLSVQNRSKLARVCATQVAIEQRTAQKAWWWIGWAECSLSEAVCYLERFCEEDLPSKADELILTICAKLNSSYGSTERAKALFRDVDALKRLIPIAFRHISTREKEDDAHWVTDRHKAEELRDRLIRDLASIGTMDAVTAMETLAEDPRLKEQRNILLNQARLCLSKHSLQSKPMSLEEALEWSRNGVILIRNSDDLFRVVLDRLDDIRESVERDEFSYRQLFQEASEDLFQKWIADQLQSEDKHGCSYTREEEAAEEKKPDIRVHHSNCAGTPVSIEIKVAENWNSRDLKEALHRQLVDLYLRKQKSRHGVLLLCSRGERKKGRKDPVCQNFSVLIDTLQCEADQRRSQSPDIDGLQVIGIDFH